MNTNEKMASAPIFPLLLSLAIPAIVAQLVNILYNMVDRIYIGRLENGTEAMAALSVSIPIITAIAAFTQLVGTGGAPLCAIKLGEKDKDKAEEIMTTSFALLLAVGVIITIVLLFFHKPLLLMFGADDKTLGMASEYISIYAVGTLFVQVTLGMNAYINTQGYAKIGMSTVLIGAVCNIILDPIFIFGLNMGVAGAALATILSQGISCFWVMKFLFGSKSVIRIRKKYLWISFKTVGAIVALGISPFIMTITESFLQISFNNQLLKYGGTVAVATMAILISLWQFIMLPLQGFCQGAQPIISYNYGAKIYSRVRKAFKITLLVCLGFALVSVSIMSWQAKTFVSLFSTEAETITVAAWALKIFIAGGIIFGAQIACQQTFLALGQAKISLLMAITRKIILLIPLIYLMPRLFGKTEVAMKLSEEISNYVIDGGGVFSVLASEPVSDIIAACITSYCFFWYYRKNLTRKDEMENKEV